MKQWIRQKKLSRLSVDSNDPTMRCPTAEPETEGLMALAEECYLAWRQHAVAFKAAVTAIYFHWRDRPASDGRSVRHSRRNLLVVPVLHAPRGRGADAPPLLLVPGLLRRRGGGARRWHAPPFELRRDRLREGGQPLLPVAQRQLSGQDRGRASSPDLRARTHGHSIATAGLEPGQWVAFGDDEDEMWLGKTLPFGDFGRGSCCKRHGGGAKKLYGTAFNTGDYMLAVQWYERLSESGDSERREFSRGERMIDVINSTELRMAGFDMGAIGVFSSVEKGQTTPRPYQSGFCLAVLRLKRYNCCNLVPIGPIIK